MWFFRPVDHATESEALAEAEQAAARLLTEWRAYTAAYPHGAQPPRDVKEQADAIAAALRFEEAAVRGLRIRREN